MGERECLGKKSMKSKKKQQNPEQHLHCRKWSGIEWLLKDLEIHHQIFPISQLVLPRLALS